MLCVAQKTLSSLFLYVCFTIHFLIRQHGCYHLPLLGQSCSCTCQCVLVFQYGFNPVLVKGRRGNCTHWHLFFLSSDSKHLISTQKHYVDPYITPSIPESNINIHLVFHISVHFSQQNSSKLIFIKH